MKNKNKLISVLLLGLLIIWAVLSFLGIQHIENLEHAIQERDNTILQMSNLDSVYTSKTQEYSEIITKYVDNCNFFIGDKKISTSDLIKMTNELLDENQIFKDSLDNLWQFKNQEHYNSMDSLQTLTRILELIKRDYGIKYTVKREGNYKIFERQLSKADSAIVLFPYYKDKLSYDTLTKAWNIKVQTIRELTPKTDEKKRKK
jgi:hypothetical protein